MKALVRLALAGLFALAFTQANATVFIRNDPGGRIVDFVDKYSRLRSTGETVVIAGDCASACTLMLGLLPKEQFCATPRAAFGFHTATFEYDDDQGRHHRDHAPEMSSLMWRMYPPRVRKLVKSLGWNGDRPEIPHPNVVWATGTNMRLIARACTEEDLK
jgi:hypothetical protein